MNFIAGVVTYNPEIIRLKQNINSIIYQVKELIIVDNCSGNIQNILYSFSSDDRITIISLSSNLGIAYAQNKICEYAKLKGYIWALILDQDSICPSNIVQEYFKFINVDNIGALCPIINDINIGIQGTIDYDEEFQEVELCIASASAINIEAWESVGHFYEDFFIDSVDFDFCLLLKQHGYKVIRVNNVQLLHEVGKSRMVRFFGKRRQILNHSPLRYYYIFRNAILLGKRHNCLFRLLKTNLLMLILINIYEDDKINKDVMIVKGIYHGIRGRFGKY